MEKVLEDEMLLPRFTVGGSDASVELENDISVGANGLGAFLEYFADAEASAEEGGV